MIFRVAGVMAAFFFWEASFATESSTQDPPACLAHDSFDVSSGRLVDSLGGGWRGVWKTSGIRAAVIVDSRSDTTVNSGGGSASGAVSIVGTGDRNNPLRRELAEAIQDKELFVRYSFLYDPDERSEEDARDGEFFVLWLDRFEGSDRATHSTNVPNIGVRLADSGPRKGKNVFMVRIGSGRTTAWSKIELERGRTYTIVGRLGKSVDTKRADFDQFDMWVDPRPQDRNRPTASIATRQGINLVRWVGFSTGRLTEATDRILIDDLVLGRTWNDVLGLPDSAAIASPTSTTSGPPAVVWDQPVDFRRDVYPLLKSRCFGCHQGTSSDSGYRLDVYNELLGYSTGEPAVVPGRSSASRLIELVATTSPDERMPPDGDGDPLSDREVALLRAWIDQGLKWDDKLLPPQKRESDHWAFQPVKRPEIPVVARSRWGRTPIDAFVANRHQLGGLSPAKEASREVLVRRLFLDLIGLPPTPDESRAFLKDASEDAYVKLVDRLLNSTHYGERWGRYWLDLARWAESQGHQHDIPRPYAWRYRDYVINSFNSDKPYDQFLKEQLAGDELQPYSDEALIATGFLGAARISGNQMDKAIQRNDALVDITNATASVVLGLTLECSQCHNHKFDPLSQRDYYRLQGFFVDGQMGNLSLRDGNVSNPTDLSQWIPKATLDFYNREVKKLVDQKRYLTPTQPYTWGFYSPASGDRDIERLPVVNRDPLPYDPQWLKQQTGRLLIRGDAGKHGPEVGSGWPEVLGGTPASLGPTPRTALAEWLGDRQNPLVSRVWVNRLWQYHFGRGIVSTPSDFGTQGALPSHPDLLDWLSAELMENNWSSKHLHRLIVLSSTYRQARKHHETNADKDPDNKLLWCWPRRRLEAEAIRDSVLVATGELRRDIGGPSIPPEREEGELRRTIYLFQRRSEMPSVMTMFDAPDGIASCSRRGVSTVALQPLFMLNSRFMALRADALASRVRREAGESVEQQIRVAFARILGRTPRSAELAKSVELLEAGNLAGEEDHRLAQFCHALLNLNEFVYIP